MAEEVIINRPAPFVEDIGKKLSEQALALQDVPVVTTSASGLTKAPGETDAGFLARQQAAQAFDVRKQNLAGIAPQVAGQDVLQQQAQGLAQQGIGSYQPFLNRAETQAQLASGLGAMSLGQLGTAASTFGGVGTGAQAFQQDVSQFMSPYQSQVIDASLAEFDRNKAIQEKSIADQALASGAFGGGREGVQRAEFQTGAARERAALQAGLLQQGFGQAQAARQQDIANQFNLAQAQAGLGQQQQGLASLVPGLQRADVAQLGSLGAINQAQQQAELDAQREATRQATFLPQEQLQQYGAQVTGLMGGYPGGIQQTVTPNPTPLQSALGVGSTLAGIYGTIKNAGTNPLAFLKGN